MMFQYFPLQQLYFEFGPQFGILASAQDKGNGVNVNAREDSINAQVALGMGVGVKMNNKLGFYGRYNFGVTDISRFDNIIDQSGAGQVGISIVLQ